MALGLVKPVTFQRMPGVSIPPGGSVTSDAVAVHVDAQEDLAVSLFVSGEAQPSLHNNAVVTSYLPRMAEAMRPLPSTAWSSPDARHRCIG